MPPSAKRNSRAKREAPTHGLEPDTPTTSPSRPSKRKRTKEAVEDHIVEPEALPKTQEELDMSDDSLITTVSQHLLLPNHFVQVAHDHDNARHQKESKNVQAYAKITGRSWTFYVKRLSTSLGRPPEGIIIPGDSPKTPAASNEGTDLPAAPTESSRIHIDLGPNKLVSRLHADIYFDPSESTWKIIVNGRNGAKVNEKHVSRGQHMKLFSGDVIEVAGVEMMFVLPEHEYKVRIHPKFLRRAGLIQPDPRDEILAMQNADETDKGITFAQPGRPLAPAPPDYRKPDTPIKTRKGYSTSPAYAAAGGTMMITSDQVDLSLDQNQHIKPMFTYSQLITQALLESPDEERTLSDIYIFLKRRYAFFRHAENEKGWQNSIRHNLSLNNGFILRARETHEPGKGGYWCFEADRRDALVADAWGGKGRRSPRKSSTPVSPRQGGRSAPGPGDISGGSPTRKVKRSPRSRSPTLAYPSNGQQFTPDRINTLSSSIHDSLPGDGSPLPRHRRPSSNVYGMSNNMHGSPPVLSSSYALDESQSLVTPAPIRKLPYLAPPSTAQRPSQHMPTSSPAPFWRFADLGNTPRGNIYDLSPSKDAFIPPALPPSSSPAPRRELATSPTRYGGDSKNEMSDVDDLQDEEPAFDLTKGFMSISKYHATNTSLGVASIAKGQV